MKTTKNKLLALLLTAVMVLSMLPAMAFAAEDAKVTVAADKVEANPGDTVTFTVSVDSNTSLGALGFALVIPEGMTFVEGSGTLLTTKADLGIEELSFTEKPNKQFVLVDYTMEEKVAAGAYDLMTFQCKVNDDATGSLTVGVEFDDVMDGSLEPISVSKVDATVTVGGSAPECTHANTEVSNAVEATCGAAGYTGDTYCKDCDEKIAAGTVIPATGAHTSFGAWTDNGDGLKHSKTCACGVVVTENHNWNGIVTTVATCKDTGVKTFTCADCGATKTESIAKDPANHVGGTEVKDVVTPTCSVDGYTGDTYCKGCGVKTAAGTVDPATGEHVYAGDWQDAEDGVGHYKECDCGDRNYAKHECNEGVVTTAATCKNTGIKTYTCTDCGATKTETIAIDPNNHTPADKWSNDETNHWKACKDCGVVIESTKAPHSLEWKTDKPATEDETGLKHRECSVCGYVCDKNTEIPKLDHAHNMTEYAAKKATCTEDGNVAYYTCSSSKCAGVYYANEAGTEELTTIVDPATGHEMKPTAAVAAKCESAGNSAYWTCDKCGKFFSDAEGNTEIEMDSWVIAALGHDWDDGAVTTKPTCETEGVMTYTCKNDVSHTKTEAIDALGHDWDDGVVTTAATCEADGVMTYTCKNDASHTKTEAIDALGHKFDGEWTVEKDPTCTDEGLKTNVCVTCQATVEEAIPATGHDFKDGKCTVCGAADPTYKPVDDNKPTDNKPVDNQPVDGNESVKTGDAGVAVWCTLLAVSALFGTAIVVKKRHA